MTAALSSTKDSGLMPLLSVSTSRAIVDHYRCPPEIPSFGVAANLKETNGFFRFGGVICYGRASGNTRSVINGNLFDASRHLARSDRTIVLPFEADEAINNLRYERYVHESGWQQWVLKSRAKDIYYSLRPLLPVSLRKHLQKIYLRGWDKLKFPGWPVDRSADILIEKLLVLAMQALEIDRIPFIWFWPEGRRACAILTHDVETAAGRDFTGRLLDIDDEFGIPSSFQIVPEKRYDVPAAYLEEIRSRGCEINVHGLDHDGNLFQDRKTFLEKAHKINHYAEQFGSQGFRSPVLYRKTDWFQDLNFSYDMSMPNVARLEPQRGGCCTVMPYFLPGGMLELPLTTIEDYTLFHILNEYSTTLWKQQMSIILQGHGLMSFIVHPDYAVSSRVQEVYRSLLEEVARLRSDCGIWVTLPGEIDRWWRERSQMTLTRSGEDWEIQGYGSERATVAYARLDGDGLLYEFGSKR